MRNILARFQLTPDEVTADQRLALAVAYKLGLEKRIRELKDLPITPDRMSAVAAKFGFSEKYLENRRVEYILKGIAQSQFFLAALTALKESK